MLGGRIGHDAGERDPAVDHRHRHVAGIQVGFAGESRSDVSPDRRIGSRSGRDADGVRCVGRRAPVEAGVDGGIVLHEGSPAGLRRPTGRHLPCPGMADACRL